MRSILGIITVTGVSVLQGVSAGTPTKWRDQLSASAFATPNNEDQSYRWPEYEHLRVQDYPKEHPEAGNLKGVSVGECIQHYVEAVSGSADTS